MRYVVAMVCAAAAALAVSLYVSAPSASWVANQFRYESPDGEATVNMIAFMAVSIAGLIAGWLVGWIIGAPFGHKRRAH